MRLIATIGANRLSHAHIYKLKNKSYKSQLSFLALAEALKITDIVLIGTQKSKESLKTVLEENNNIEMVIVESANIEDVFKKSLEYITKDTVLDLTQGFRHYPMLTLLAAVFLQSDNIKNIQNIYYAQIEDETCNPRDGSCPYSYVSLMKYLDISNMARIINTFINTLIVLDYPVHDSDFLKLKQGLEKISAQLFSNNFKATKKETENIIETIDHITANEKLSFVDMHLGELKKEIKKIQKLTQSKESQTLFNFSKYFLQKDILLHSLTLLYESMVAFLDEKIKEDKQIHIPCKDVNDIFKRRNCLKKERNKCKKFKFYKCKEFDKALRNIDKLRNISAHGFTSDSHDKNLENEIKETIELFNQIINT